MAKSAISAAVSAAVRAFQRSDAVIVTITRNIPTAGGKSFDKVTIRSNRTGAAVEYFLNASSGETTFANGIVEEHFALARMESAAPSAPSAPVAEEAAA